MRMSITSNSIDYVFLSKLELFTPCLKTPVRYVIQFMFEQASRDIHVVQPNIALKVRPPRVSTPQIPVFVSATCGQDTQRSSRLFFDVSATPKATVDIAPSTQKKVNAGYRSLACTSTQQRAFIIRIEHRRSFLEHDPLEYHVSLQTVTRLA